MFKFNNNDVIGKWEYQYSFDNSDNKEVENDLKFDTIYFLPNGVGYWIFEKWDSKKLYIHYGGDDPILEYSYKLKTIKNEIYMLLSSNDKEETIVLKKIDNKKYTKYEIGKHDNIEYNFINDSEVLGVWKSINFLETIDYENVDIQNVSNDLFVQSINFKDDGTAQMFYYNGKIWNDKWAKNILIDKEKETSSKYVIKNIDGDDYLILEWKMGNYVYGDGKTQFYIFKRLTND